MDPDMSLRDELLHGNEEDVAAETTRIALARPLLLISICIDRVEGETNKKTIKQTCKVIKTKCWNREFEPYPGGNCVLCSGLCNQELFSSFFLTNTWKYYIFQAISPHQNIPHTSLARDLGIYELNHESFVIITFPFDHQLIDLQTRDIKTLSSSSDSRAGSLIQTETFSNRSRLPS